MIKKQPRDVQKQSKKKEGRALQNKHRRTIPTRGKQRKRETKDIKQPLKNLSTKFERLKAQEALKALVEWALP